MSALKGEVTIREPTRGQQAIARRVAEARATIPDITVEAELEMDAVTRLSRSWGANPTDFVVGACARALRAFPTVNASYRDGHFELYSRVNVGIVVPTEESQAVPTILDADRKSVREIAGERTALAGHVEQGTITPAELAGATFTISDLGIHDVARFQAVIVAPQAAVLALGALRSGVTLQDGRVAERLVLAAAMSCDHRIVYGATAASFLARVRELLAAPAEWAE